MTDTHAPLVLERRDQPDGTGVFGGGAFLLAPNVSEDYWTYRVRLTEAQAVVGFPKFSTIGIGFAVEEDWNTNLPYTCDTEMIYQHIQHNRGDESIEGKRVREAIALIQAAAAEDRAVTP